MGARSWAAARVVAGALLFALLPGAAVADEGVAGTAHGLCFAISAMVSPARTFTDYQAFV
ncbi:MAG: hypothetical protein GW824_05800, partial [Deltaproteobacteria bacterium]|nr:hypothetical protein [Deltaproteobacteria bacterium]